MSRSHSSLFKNLNFVSDQLTIDTVPDFITQLVVGLVTHDVAQSPCHLHLRCRPPCLYHLKTVFQSSVRLSPAPFGLLGVRSGWYGPRHPERSSNFQPHSQEHRTSRQLVDSGCHARSQGVRLHHHSHWHHPHQHYPPHHFRSHSDYRLCSKIKH